MVLQFVAIAAAIATNCTLGAIPIQGLPLQRDFHRCRYLQPTTKATDRPMMQKAVVPWG